MPDLDVEQLEILRHKLDEFKATLSSEQAELLDAILTIAWQFSSGEDSLDSAFGGSFTPGEAAFLTSYASGGAAGSGMIRGHVVGMIKAPPTP